MLLRPDGFDRGENLVAEGQDGTDLLHLSARWGSPMTAAVVVAVAGDAAWLNASQWHVMCGVTGTVTSIFALVPPSRWLASALYQTQMSPMFARAIGRKLETLLTIAILL